jgi:cyclic lactone autoinducer peptide
MNTAVKLVAELLAKLTFASAVAGAEAASLAAVYQPKTPECLATKKES